MKFVRISTEFRICSLSNHNFCFRLKDQLDNKANEIDLQGMTSESRFCRMEMVQTLGQYKFLHDVALYMIRKYDNKGMGSIAPAERGEGEKFSRGGGERSRSEC